MPELQGAFTSENIGSGLVGFPITINMFDSGNNSTGSSWTAGAVNICQLPVGPTLSKPWTIYGWSVQLQGIMMAVASAGQPSYGLLGKVLSSLVVGSGGVTPGIASKFTPPPQTALANLQTVWDGSTDPPWPFLDPANMTALPPSTGFVHQTFQLPQPQILGAGEQLAIGLWQTPSLIHAVVNIIIYNARYSVTYSS